MNVFHISAECYPAAKVGGLADVVGALPRYQKELSIKSNVVMPFYNNSFTKNNTFKEIHESTLKLGENFIEFKILKLTNNNSIGFNLFFVDVPRLLYKKNVYSSDDTERFLAFQIATLDWFITLEKTPDILHVHDHHTGLVPFMISQCFKYKTLKNTPTVLTIHNAQYQGWFPHLKVQLIPPFEFSNVGLIDWDGNINPLAAAIKCAWRITTVSPSYMEELKQNANGLESLLSHESKKCIGILNGIDWNVWNPQTDEYVIKKYSIKTNKSGKKANKNFLCKEFNLNNNKPLFAFIGRLVGEKGADLLPQIFEKSLLENDISILLLGSGNKETEKKLSTLKREEKYNNFIGYDEKLSHIIYAGADFLLMPSRVEPCGLNQMYALRYGTVPIVNSIGGLKDTIVDINDGGFGVCHNGVSIENVTNAIKRAAEFYTNQKEFIKNSKYIMSIDHSWNNSAQEYVKLYQSLKK